MELRQLEYFVAVAEEGNFTKAAARCAVSQPSLSQAIINLERDVKQQLFDRLGRSVQLTDAGRLLLDRALDILHAIADTRKELRDLGQPAALSVGAIPTMAPYLFPDILPRFRERYPETTLHIREDYTPKLLEAIGTGQLDLAIMALPVEDERCSSQALFREPLIVALPHQHPLLDADDIGLRELLSVPFILLDEMHCLGEQVVTFCRRQPNEPQIVCRGSQLSTILALVALGQGVSLVPEMATRNDTSGCEFRLVRGESPSRTVAAVWHRRRYRSPLVRAFIEMVKTFHPGDSGVG